MIRLKNMQDVKEKVKDAMLQDYILSSNDQLADDAGEEGETESFLSYFGGYVFVLENAMELQKIPVASNWGGTEERSIVDVAEVYDIARYVCKGRYAEIMLITNNGGGDIYFIPYEISKRCSNVNLAIRMTVESEHEAANRAKLSKELGDVRYDDGMDEAKEVEKEMKEAEDPSNWAESQTLGTVEGPDGEDGPWAEGYDERVGKKPQDLDSLDGGPGNDADNKS